MTHVNQKHWFENILKEKLPECFENVRVLDVGALDINGNNRHYFENSEYIGLDVIEGKNVDVVSPCHKWDEPDESFDVVISTNALEHDMYMPKTLEKMYNLLVPGGYLLISAAHSFPAHGTLKDGPDQSGTAQIKENDWCNYYKNVNQAHFRKALNIGGNKSTGDSDLFDYYFMEDSYRDVRFIGQKIGNPNPGLQNISFKQKRNTKKGSGKKHTFKNQDHFFSEPGEDANKESLKRVVKVAKDRQDFIDKKLAKARRLRAGRKK